MKYPYIMDQLKNKALYNYMSIHNKLESMKRQQREQMHLKKDKKHIIVKQHTPWDLKHLMLIVSKQDEECSGSQHEISNLKRTKFMLVKFNKSLKKKELKIYKILAKIGKRYDL